MSSYTLFQIMIDDIIWIRNTEGKKNREMIFIPEIIQVKGHWLHFLYFLRMAHKIAESKSLHREIRKIFVILRLSSEITLHPAKR